MALTARTVGIDGVEPAGLVSDRTAASAGALRAASGGDEFRAGAHG